MILRVLCGSCLLLCLGCTPQAHHQSPDKAVVADIEAAIATHLEAMREAQQTTVHMSETDRLDKAHQLAMHALHEPSVQRNILAGELSTRALQERAQRTMHEALRRHPHWQEDNLPPLLRYLASHAEPLDRDGQLLLHALICTLIHDAGLERPTLESA